MTENPFVFQENLLEWYDGHRRVLPWRALPGKDVNPYYVWLSEVMLQQTTVQAVIPYFLHFVQRWPTVHCLAQADSDEVMAAWAGLGYYARARNLLKCAKVVSEDLDGVFPKEINELKKLPGVGDYTSAAIRSIAFDLPAVVVDGNVDRVMARYFAINTPFPDGKAIVKAYAMLCAESVSRPGDYAQSLMDLGATICTPKSPACNLCPIRDGCQAYSFGQSGCYPKKSPKKEKPHKVGYVYWVLNDRNQALIHQRPEKGLLGGMMGLPTSSWEVGDLIRYTVNIADIEFCDEEVEDLNISIQHVFTHFSLELRLCVVRNFSFVPKNLKGCYFFMDLNDINPGAFPTVFKKAIRLFLK